MARKVVYFDLETQRTAQEAGGWNRKDAMGMSLGVTYSTATGEYKIYLEEDAGELVEDLRRADLVVGFNVVGFDFEVLRAYSIYELAELVPTLDLLLELEKVLGHRIGLDSVAEATLGAGKTGDGLDAIRWYREGKLREIAEYCCHDVKATRLVHLYGERFGQVFYTDRAGRKQAVKIKWSK